MIIKANIIFFPENNSLFYPEKIWSLDFVYTVCNAVVIHLMCE